jgi:hypothetical protein
MQVAFSRSYSRSFIFIVGTRSKLEEKTTFHIFFYAILRLWWHAVASCMLFVLPRDV